MKIMSLGLGLSMIISTATGQTHLVCDQNDATYLLGDDGIFFNNPSTNEAAYQIPKNSGVHAVYMMQALAFVINNQDTLGAGVYYENGKEWFKGPIATSYTDPSYLSKYGSAIWQVNKTDIDYHIQNFGTANYIMPASIANWPGSGNTSNGEAEFLAPFIDVDHNGVYSPQGGDYPEIRGDQSTYIIMNDQAGPHTYTGFGSASLELHLMFYNFVSTDFDNQTTWLNARLINRSNTNYPVSHFGLFIDFDLGNYNDDLLGTNSLKNLAFVYNGDLLDETNSGSAGYQENPPAFGVVSLNNQLFAHVFSSTASQTTRGKAILNELNGLHSNGSVMTDALGITTRFHYDRAYNGYWNELNDGQIVGDRKSVIGLPPDVLPAQGQRCFDFAFIYARPNDAVIILDAVDLIEQTATQAQTRFDSRAYTCPEAPVAGIKNQLIEAIITGPNPVEEVLQLRNIEAFDFEIYTIDGKRLMQDHCSNNQIQVSELNKGMYILAIQKNGSLSKTTFLKN